MTKLPMLSRFLQIKEKNQTTLSNTLNNKRMTEERIDLPFSLQSSSYPPTQ